MYVIHRRRVVIISLLSSNLQRIIIAQMLSIGSGGECDISLWLSPTCHADRYSRFCNCANMFASLPNRQGRIKASAGPGAVPNAGPLQTLSLIHI